MSRLEEVIARMAVEPAFAVHVRAHPDQLAQEYELSPEEVEQVLRLTDAPAGPGPAELDPRVNKSWIGPT